MRECGADEMKEEETGEFIKKNLKKWGRCEGGSMQLDQMLRGEGEDSALCGE